MVEGAGLENRYIRKGIEGSNPSLSARYPYPVSLNHFPFRPFFNYNDVSIRVSLRPEKAREFRGSPTRTGTRFGLLERGDAVVIRQKLQALSAALVRTVKEPGLYADGNGLNLKVER